MKKNKQQIIDEINNELKALRDNAKEIAQENKLYAYEKTNAYEHLCACQNLIYEIGVAKAKGLNDENLRKEYNIRHELFKQELKKVGFETKDLKPTPKCKKCNDTGMFGHDYCGCFAKRLSEKLLQNSCLNVKTLPSFENADFAIFDKNVVEDVKKLYDFAKKYATDRNPNKYFLTICGKVGVGKTHLTQCMLNEYIKREKFVQFINAFELNETFLKYHTSPIDEKQNVIETILTCDVLVIDDLGVENIFKNVTIENLYMLISMRQNANRITIITTNLQPDEINEKYDERIFSRICDKQNCYLFNFAGSDLRLKKR